MGDYMGGYWEGHVMGCEVVMMKVHAGMRSW